MSTRLLIPAVLAGLFVVAVPGSVQAKGYLGVQIKLNPDGKGLLITDVLPDSPAEKAELKADDVILKIDGVEPTSLKEFVEIIGNHATGDKVTLDIKRQDKVEKIKVSIGEKPD